MCIRWLGMAGPPAAEQRCHGVRARSRRGPADIQDIVIGIVERKRTGLLDGRLCEYRRCEYQRDSMVATPKTLNWSWLVLG
jgi:hypothetical protein